MEPTREKQCEDLCWAVAHMPAELVGLANQHGIDWAEATRNEARRILSYTDKMEKERYKGYEIEIKQYGGRQSQTEASPDNAPMFDYVITDEAGGRFLPLDIRFGKIECCMKLFDSIKEATIAAKERIDSIIQDRNIGG